MQLCVTLSAFFHVPTPSLTYRAPHNAVIAANEYDNDICVKCEEKLHIS